MNAKKLATFLMMIVVGLVVIGCGRDDEVTVKLALDWYANSNHLGIFIAQEKGDFAEERLSVELYTRVDPSTVL